MIYLLNFVITIIIFVYSLLTLQVYKLIMWNDININHSIIQQFSQFKLG